MSNDILDTLDRWRLIAIEYIESCRDAVGQGHQLQSGFTRVGQPQPEFGELTDSLMLWCDDTGIDPSPLWDVYRQTMAYFIHHKGFAWTGYPPSNYQEFEEVCAKAIGVCQRIQNLAIAREKNTAKTRRPDAIETGKPPRSPIELAIYNILAALPDEGAITCDPLVKKLNKQGFKDVSTNSLSKHLKKVGTLRRHWGVKNRPRVGYYIDKSAKK